MPTPKKGEKRSSFVQRYMKSGEAEKSFPKAKQRYAVAESIYSRKGKGRR